MARWQSPGGERYAAHFDALAATGVDVHGEAAFVERHAAPGARVLDAGCGTGRVAIRLAQRGFAVVGADADAGMLAVARSRAPELEWVERDLAHPLPDTFDVVVAVGNVIPLVDDPPRVVANLAAALGPDGLLITGFGLDADHLPLDEPTVTLEEFDRWCDGAGLLRQERYATWDEEPYQGGGYVVTVSRRRPTIADGAQAPAPAER